MIARRWLNVAAATLIRRGLVVLPAQPCARGNTTDGSASRSSRRSRSKARNECSVSSYAWCVLSLPDEPCFSSSQAVMHWSRLITWLRGSASTTWPISCVKPVKGMMSICPRPCFLPTPLYHHGTKSHYVTSPNVCYCKYHTRKTRLYIHLSP